MRSRVRTDSMAQGPGEGQGGEMDNQGQMIRLAGLWSRRHDDGRACVLKISAPPIIEHIANRTMLFIELAHFLAHEQVETK